MDRRMLGTVAGRVLRFAAVGWLALAVGPAGSDPASPLVSREPIFEKPPFLSCHASTIAETPNSLVAAWFGGTGEGKSDVDIWVSRNEKSHWSAPVDVANGVQPDGMRLPCWNPVLFQAKGGPLVLFYKIGPNPQAWWGMRITSPDGGTHWSSPERLPDGILGPIKDKPTLLPDGRLLCPSSTEDQGWRIHFEWTRDLGKSWERTPPVNDGQQFGLIQPTILRHPGGKLQALCRSKQHRIVETWSTDGGRTWSAPAATELPNPNSGIDAVTLTDGRHLLVYNHTERGRSPLTVAISRDGKHWTPVIELENTPGEFSYPAVIQTADGLVHITYTWLRINIRHAVLDPARIGAAR